MQRSGGRWSRVVGSVAQWYLKWPTPFPEPAMLLLPLLHAADDLGEMTQVFYVRDRELKRLNVVR